MLKAKIYLTNKNPNKQMKSDQNPGFKTKQSTMKKIIYVYVYKPLNILVYSIIFPVDITFDVRSVHRNL